MVTPEDVRGCALALPEVAEKPHFGRPGFRVGDKLMVSLHDDGDVPTAIVGVTRGTAARETAVDPEAFEEVWRSDGRIFVGLRVDLSTVTIDRLRGLVEDAWRNKAPKRLVKAYDEAGS